jgi:hypothetical protein
MEWKQWIVGLAFAVVAGGIVTPFFLYPLRWGLKLRKKRPPGRVPAWLTGAVERFVFCVFVGLDVSGAGTAMMAWLGLKLATNWNHVEMTSEPSARTFAFSALVAGLVSMLFAVLGGYVARGDLWARYIAGIC